MLGEQLLVVSNPRKKRRRKNPRMQRNSKGRFVKRGHAARASNPKRRRKRRANPVAHRSKVRYRTRTVTKYKTRRASNPHRRHRRRRSNPSFKLGGFTMKSVLHRIAPAMIGGAGALATDFLFQKTPLATYIPAQFSTGYLKYATRAAGVLAVAFAVGKIKPAYRNDVLAGGLAVVAYSLLKDLANNVGGMALADYDDMGMGYMAPSPQVLQAYMQNYAGTPSVALPAPKPKQAMHAYMAMNDFNTADMAF